MKEIKFEIFNKDDQLVATIMKNENGLQLISEEENRKELPYILQDKDITEDKILYFLNTRIVNGTDIIPNTTSGDNYRRISLPEKLKLNSGRVFTDDFYIIVVEGKARSEKVKVSSVDCIDLESLVRAEMEMDKFLDRTKVR